MLDLGCSAVRANHSASLHIYIGVKSFTLAALLMGPTLACSAVIWDEAIHGDLSNNHLAPDTLTVGIGSNLLIGSTGNYDRDYFHFSLQPGMALTAIILVDYVSEDHYAFIAIQEGTFITEDPENPDVGNLLGWTLFGPHLIGQDLLAPMGQGYGAIGFTPPLTGSDYAFWLQQTGDPTDYVLDFQIVPEPSTWIALLSLAGLTFLRRRHNS